MAVSPNSDSTANLFFTRVEGCFIVEVNNNIKTKDLVNKVAEKIKVDVNKIMIIVGAALKMSKEPGNRPSMVYLANADKVDELIYGQFRTNIVGFMTKTTTAHVFVRE